MPRPDNDHDTGQAWLILAACFAMQFFCGGAISNLVSVGNDDISRAVGVSKFTVLLLTSSLLYLSMAAFQLLIGLFSHRFTQRQMLLTGCVAGIAGFALVGAATRPWQVALAFGPLLGFSLASAQVVTNGVVVAWFERYRGAALAILAMGVSAASIVVAPVYAWAATALSWRAVPQLLAAATVLVFVLLLVLPVDRDGREAQATPHTARDGSGRRGLLKSKPLWSMAITMGTISIIVMAVLANLRRYAGDLAIAPTLVALLFSAQAAGAIAGKMFFMLFSNRLTQRQIAALPLLFIVAGVGTLALAQSFGIALAAIVSLGVAFGLGVPGLPAVLAAHFQGANFLPAAGTCMTISTLGVIVGPPGLAALHELTGAYPPIFAVMAVATAILLVPVILLLPARRFCTATITGRAFPPAPAAS